MMEAQNHTNASDGAVQLTKHIGTTAFEISKPLQSIQQKIENSDTYITIPTCLFEAIICNSNLSALERAFYFRAITCHQLNKARPIEISAEAWAKHLGVVDRDAAQSRSKILRVQKSLECKGFLQVTRRRNVRNKHMRNKITPLIPDSLYQSLQDAPSRCSKAKQQKLENESNLDCIMRTKLFVPINYKYLKWISKDPSISHSCKLFFLRNYICAYKNYQTTGRLSFCTTTDKLVTNDYSYRTVLRLLQMIKQQEDGLVTVEHKHMYHNDYDTNTCDKPVYKFTFNTKLLPKCIKKVATDQQDETSILPMNENTNIVEQDVLPSSNISNNATNIDNTTSSLKSVSTNSYQKLKPQDHTRNSFDQFRTLKSYYPFSQTEVDYINKKSHRDFSLNFANQLLLKLYSKYPEKTFPTWHHFNSYMIEVFKHELHQGANVNRQSFRFKCNIINESAYTDEQKIERYLAQVESSYISTHETELRCKIANVFKPKTAYAILSNVDFINEKNAVIAKFSRDISLSEKEEAMLIREISAIYGTAYSSVPVEIQYFNHDSSSSYQSQTTDPPATTPGIDANSPCYALRLGIIEEIGISFYKSWFANIKIVIDADNMILELIAPNGFTASWIRGHYDSIIRSLSSNLGFTCVHYSYVINNTT